MDKVIFNQIGGSFQHAYSSCGWEHPKYVTWDKTNQSGDISVHIDEAVFNVPVNRNKYNIAWFAESPWLVRKFTILLENEQYINYLKQNFKVILSNDKPLIKQYDFIKYCIPTAYPWIKDKRIYNKSKFISIIASEKNEAPGHQLRHYLVNTLKDYIDVYGRAYNPIEKKEIGLQDYMYSIVIENVKCDGYFTEKIGDCFATGTIPIYWGDDTIGEYFNEDGIIKLTDEFDFSILTEDVYNSKMGSIIENFKKINSFNIPEDYIFTHYLK